MKSEVRTTAATIAAALTLAFSTLAPAGAQRARLVGDINSALVRAGMPTAHTPIQAAGGLTYYVLGDAATGAELWASDVSGRSYLVRDIQPGPLSSSIVFIGALDNRLVFHALTSLDGNEIWISDGTASGTRIIQDLSPNHNSGMPNRSLSARIGSHLYFVAAPENAYDIFRTDGTTIEAVTRFRARGALQPWILKAVGTELFFRFNDGTHGNKIWFIDTASTSRQPNMLVDFTGESSGEMEAIGDLVWFQGSSAQSGTELYIYNRRTRQLVLHDLLAGSASSSPRIFTSLGSKLFFFADDAQMVPQLWTSDGTQAGTNRVFGTTSIGPLSRLVASSGRLVFDSPTNRKIYISDGTASGTFAIDAQLLAVDGTHLWTLEADQRSFARRRVGDVHGLIFMTTQVDPRRSSLWAQFGANGELWFYVNDEMWVSAGTAATTMRFQPGSTGRTESSFPSSLTAFGDACAFAATDASGRRSLWITDGSSAGTQRLTPALGASIVREVEDLAVFDRRLWFSLYELGELEVWSSDGTRAGTKLTLNLNGPSSSNPKLFVATSRALWFWAIDPTRGNELFRSDGTATGTRLAVDATPGPSGSDVVSMWAIGERLFFYRRVLGGVELMSTDGTATGTQALRQPAAKTHLVAITQGACFTAEYDGSGAWTLVASDGSVEGTHVVDRQKGGDEVPQGAVLAASDALVVAKQDGLWRIDRYGASLLAPGRYLSPTAVQDVAVGLRFDTIEEVYSSDGTAMGTRSGPPHMLPLLRGSSRGQLRPLGTSRLSSITTGSVMTCGLDGDSTLDHELRTESTSSQAIVVAGKLFIEASSDFGSELYVVDEFGPVSSIVGRGCGTGIRTPTLTAAEPRLGRIMDVRASGIRSGDIAVLCAGMPAEQRIADSCPLIVDISQLALISPTRTTQGHASWSVPLPWGAQLIGRRLRWQALGVPPLPTPRDIETTNGLDSLLKP